MDVNACKKVDRDFLVEICEDNGVPKENIESLIVIMIIIIVLQLHMIIC